MADYRWGSDELQSLMESVIEDDTLPLDDLREHPLHIRIGSIFYADDDAFDQASRKKQGGKPVRIRLTDNWVRSLTGGNGLMKGQNDNATGVECVILVDPAIFDTYPEHAQRGHIFNVLSWLRLEKKEDEEGNLVAKTKDGRPVWKINKPPVVSAITTRHFGAIDAASAAVLAAGMEAGEKQLLMAELWTPSEPKGVDDDDPDSNAIAADGEPEPRDVGEEEPEDTE